MKKIIFLIYSIFLFILLKIYAYFFFRETDNFWIQNLGQIKTRNRTDYILELCRNKRVVHMGFGDYPLIKKKIDSGRLLHIKLKHICADIIGIDNNSEAVEYYRKITGDQNVITCDINDIANIKHIISNFDIFLLGEILEHLHNPAQAIEAISKVMKQHALLIISVPNAYRFLNFLAAVNNYEFIHPHHVNHYSPYTLKNIVESYGFKLVELYAASSESSFDFILKKFPLLADGFCSVFERT